MLAGGGHFLARLVIATGISGAIAAFRPALSYTGVAAVVMALHPDPALPGALERALAILIGSASGAGATFLVWPEFGRSRTARLIRDSLEAILGLLKATLDDESSGESREEKAADARFLGTFQSARTAASESWFRPRLSSGSTLDQALLATESLWHGLVILERVSRDERPSLDVGTLDRIRPALEEVKECAGALVEKLMARLEGGDTSVSTHPIEHAVGQAKRVVKDRFLRLAEPAGVSGRALHALIFALDQVETNLIDIAKLLGPAKTPRWADRD